MNSSIEQTGNKVTLNLTADETDLSPTARSVFNRLREQVDAKGFRPGKAPNNIVERELGTDRVHAEIIDAAAEKLYRQAVKEHELRPIGHPHVAVKKFVPVEALELEVTLEVMPEVKLPDYKKIKKTAPAVKISAKEIDEVLNSLQTRLAKRKPVERAAKSGDEVSIDFSGKRGGVEVPGAKAKDYSLTLGSNSFIPGFEDQLVGLKAGATKQFDISFPDDYPEASLSGQKVTFDVEVKKVSEVKPPELNDTFAKEAGPFKDLSSLRKDIEGHLTAEKERSAQKQFENEVVQAVVDKAKLELPKSIVEQEVSRIKADVSNQLEQQGLSEAEYLKQADKTKEEHEAAILTQAEARVKAALVITEVAKQEKLSVTPEELEVRLQVLAGQYQDEKIQEQLQQPEVKSEIANQLLTEKAVQKLVEYATADTSR